jgi:hypothetical protein
VSLRQRVDGLDSSRLANESVRLNGCMGLPTGPMNVGERRWREGAKAVKLTTVSRGRKSDGLRELSYIVKSSTPDTYFLLHDKWVITVGVGVR